MSQDPFHNGFSQNHYFPPEQVTQNPFGDQVDFDSQIQSQFQPFAQNSEWVPQFEQQPNQETQFQSPQQEMPAEFQTQFQPEAQSDVPSGENQTESQSDTQPEPQVEPEPEPEPEPPVDHLRRMTTVQGNLTHVVKGRAPSRTVARPSRKPGSRNPAAAIAIERPPEVKNFDEETPERASESEEDASPSRPKTSVMKPMGRGMPGMPGGFNPAGVKLKAAAPVEKKQEPSQPPSPSFVNAVKLKSTAPPPVEKKQEPQPVPEFANALKLRPVTEKPKSTGLSQSGNSTNNSPNHQQQTSVSNPNLSSGPKRGPGFAPPPGPPTSAAPPPVARLPPTSSAPPPPVGRLPAASAPPPPVGRLPAASAPPPPAGRLPPPPAAAPPPPPTAAAPPPPTYAAPPPPTSSPPPPPSGSGSIPPPLFGTVPPPVPKGAPPPPIPKGAPPPPIPKGTPPPPIHSDASPFASFSSPPSEPIISSSSDTRASLSSSSPTVDENRGKQCETCAVKFGLLGPAKIHCKNCWKYFCKKCSKKGTHPDAGITKPTYFCDFCFGEVCPEANV